MTGHRPEDASQHATLRLMALGILIPNAFFVKAAPWRFARCRYSAIQNNVQTDTYDPRRPGPTPPHLSCRPNQPRIFCRQRRYIDQMIPPVYPRFGLPIVYEAAQWQPIDHTVAI